MSKATPAKPKNFHPGDPVEVRFGDRWIRGVFKGPTNYHDAIYLVDVGEAEVICAANAIRRPQAMSKTAKKPKFQVGDEVEITIRVRGRVKCFGPLFDSYEVAWTQIGPYFWDKVFDAKELRRAKL